MQPDAPKDARRALFDAEVKDFNESAHSRDDRGRFTDGSVAAGGYGNSGAGMIWQYGSGAQAIVNAAAALTTGHAFYGDDDLPAENYDMARTLMADIDAAPPNSGNAYHGTQVGDDQDIDRMYPVGAQVGIPIMATTPDPRLAAMYAGAGGGREPRAKDREVMRIIATTVEDPQARRDALMHLARTGRWFKPSVPPVALRFTPGHPSLLIRMNERLVSGQFTVTGRTEVPMKDGGWYLDVDTGEFHRNTGLVVDLRYDGPMDREPDGPQSKQGRVLEAKGWDEDAHPRDEHGRFGEGGGGVDHEAWGVTPDDEWRIEGKPQQLVASSADWERSAPWSMDRATLAGETGNRPPLVRFDARLGNEARNMADGIHVGPKFLDMPYDADRRYTLYHELGHELADAVARSGKLFDLDYGDPAHPGALGGRGPNGVYTYDPGSYEEMLADAYAHIATGSPGDIPEALRAEVTDRATRMGLPLPGRSPLDDQRDAAEAEREANDPFLRTMRREAEMEAARRAAEGKAVVAAALDGRQAKNFDPDQPRDDRGRFGDGDSPAPPAAGYTHVSVEERVAQARADAAARTGMPGAADQAERSARSLAHTRTTWRSATGNRVEVCTTPRLTAVRQREACEAFDALNRAYPGTNRTLSIVNPKITTAMASKYTLGLTRTGGAHIVVSAHACQPAAQTTIRESGADGRFSPAAATAVPVAYIVAHEFGHTLDSPREKISGRYTMQRNPDTQRALETLPPTSKYGTPSGPRDDMAEKYAEAFAEWWCSKGQTDLPLSQALAKTEGWRLPS